MHDTNPRAVASRFASSIIMVVAALGAARCGSSSTTAPTNGTAISEVSLAATTASVGATVQGTVKLSAPATASASIALSSSNAAVATVQSPVTVQAGASSAAFTVTAVAPGTATITASMNGATAQSPALSVTGGSLASISLSAQSVVGGSALTGTATLTQAAPAGGAAVALSATDPATVPANVTVPAGTTSATFSVTTRVVGGPLTATITGTYGGVTKSATVAVTQPTVATANFGVSGPTETETCTLTNGGNTIECTFDGHTSTAPGTITAYDWTYTVAKTVSQTTTGPVLQNPTVDCSFVPPPPLPADTPWLTMTVTLVIHDSLGNVSAKAVDSGVRLIPKSVCGY
jgi:trimeric autotransporter adhesin